MLRSATLLGKHARFTYCRSGVTLLGRSLCSSSSGSHLQPDNKIVGESLMEHPYHDLLVKVSNMTRERTKLREIASLMDTIPIESLIQAVAKQIKSSSMIIESQGDHANPLLTVVDALIFVKSSDQLRSLVDYLRHDAVMAHQIGARRILLACEAVVDADYMNSNSIQKGGNIAVSSSDSTSSSTKQSGHKSNPVSNHRLNRQQMIEQELTKSFVPLLCSMPPHVRCHHITALMSCHAWKGTGINRVTLIKSLMNDVQHQLTHAHQRGERVDFTAVGDVAVSGFNGLRLIKRHDLALQFLQDCQSSGILHTSLMSKEGYTLAVTNCLPVHNHNHSKRETHKGEGGANTSSTTIKRDLWPQGLDALFALAHGNSFKAISLREHFLKILASRGCSELVPAYAEKIESSGWLLGTRAYNCLISAHMRMNDHRSALNALDRLSIEFKFVRRQVEKGGLKSLFGEDCDDTLSSSSSSSRSSESTMHSNISSTQLIQPQPAISPSSSSSSPSSSSLSSDNLGVTFKAGGKVLKAVVPISHHHSHGTSSSKTGDMQYYYTSNADLARPTFGVNMFSFSAVLMSGWLRQNFNRNGTTPHHQPHHRQYQPSSSNNNSTHTHTTHHENTMNDTTISTISTDSPTAHPSSDTTTAAGIIIGTHHHNKEKMTGQEACNLAGKLFDRMRKSGANPDARLLFRIAQLADVGNDVNLMSKVLTLAHQNSHVGANYALFQPHTKLDLPHSITKGGGSMGGGLEKGPELGQSQTQGQGPESKSMDQNTNTKSTTRIFASSSALEKTLQDLNALTAHTHHTSEHDHDHDNEHHYHSNNKNNTTEISSSSLSLSSSSANKPSWSLLTHTDLAKLYRLALDCARSAKRPGRVKLYLTTMTEAHIPLSNRMSEVAMQCFLETNEPENVVWVFESIPAWKGQRTQRHAALLIQALVSLGRLSDAWRAMQQMKKGVDNPDGILPPMYSGAMFLLLKRIAFSLTQRGYYSHRDYSVKKMTRAMKLTVAATLAVDIIRCHDAYRMTEEASHRHKHPLRRVASLLASIHRYADHSEGSTDAEILEEILATMMTLPLSEKDAKIAVDLCATIRHMVKGEIKEEDEIDEAAVGSDHDSIVPKHEENDDDENTMEMNEEDENDHVIEQQKRI